MPRTSALASRVSPSLGLVLGLSLGLSSLPGIARAQVMMAIEDPPAGVETPPADAPPAPALPSAVAEVDTTRSWSWVLARPGAVGDGHVLLAADGHNQAVFVVAWGPDGRVTTFGVSQDARGGALGDLADRMAKAANPLPDAAAPEAFYWGAWSVATAGEEAATNTGHAAWSASIPALRAAVEGERTRARPFPLSGAGAVLLAFPLPPTAQGAWDVVAGESGMPALQGPLAYLTQSATPTPFAPLAGLPNGWTTPGAWGRYQDSQGRGWAFTVLEMN